MTNHFLVEVELTGGQIAFIIVLALVLLAGIVLGIYLPVHFYRLKNYFNEYCYRIIRRIVVKKDYYLINKFYFNVDKTKYLVDHIIFANKYIYVLTDLYYDGSIKGKYDDSSFRLVTKKGETYYTDNPLLKQKRLLSSLSSVTGIDSSLMVGIVVINDSCSAHIESQSKQFYAIQKRRLGALIDAIESRNVGNINASEMAQVVQSVSKINRRKEKQ